MNYAKEIKLFNIYYNYDNSMTYEATTDNFDKCSFVTLIIYTPFVFVSITYTLLILFSSHLFFLSIAILREILLYPEIHIYKMF